MTDAFIEPSKREDVQRWTWQERALDPSLYYHLKPHRDNVLALLAHAAEADRRIAALHEQLKEVAAEKADLLWKVAAQAQRIEELEELYKTEMRRHFDCFSETAELHKRVAVLTSERDKARELSGELAKALDLHVNGTGKTWGCLGPEPDCDYLAHAGTCCMDEQACREAYPAHRDLLARAKDAACPATEPTPSEPDTGGTQTHKWPPQGFEARIWGGKS
jgi:uncharacterized small protein (DUF1192 family)